MSECVGCEDRNEWVVGSVSEWVSELVTEWVGC